MTQPLVGADATGMMANAEMPDSPTVNAASLPTTVAWALPEHYTNVSIDRAFKANLARLTLGVSPVALAQPYFDWLAHLVTSPGKQIQLVENAVRTSAYLAAYVCQAVTNADTPPCITSVRQDHRFQAAA
jgi:polyhydroxyalkanoate synthase subunit PhaC